MSSTAGAGGERPLIVSSHAKLRYRQRVDRREPFPGERLRELFRQGTETGNAIADNARARVADGWLIAYREAPHPVITTVVEARRDDNGLLTDL